VVLPLVGVSPAGADTPWFRVAVPSPGDNGVLTDVSCTTPTDCVAVGRYGGGPLQYKTLILRTVNGVSWSRIRSPNPGYEHFLEAVSCVSATECTAVGAMRLPNDPEPLFDPDLRPLVLRTTDGTDWAWVPTDAYGEQSWLVDVSCTSAVRCRAVGSAGNAGSDHILLRTTNGTRWLRQSIPASPTRTTFKAIDCASNVRCTAVGYFGPSNRFLTLVLQTTDGRTWERRASPNPVASGDSARLEDVSCTGPVCSAVGYAESHPIVPSRAFILRTTDGLSWTRAATPPDSPTWLTSVTCTSATECTATGELTSSHLTEILRTTNGTTWTSLDHQSARDGRDVAAVSCPIPTACTAVGVFRIPPTANAQRALVLKET